MSGYAGARRHRPMTVGRADWAVRAATCPGPRIAQSSQRPCRPPCRRPGRPCPRSWHPPSRRSRQAADLGPGRRLAPFSWRRQFPRIQSSRYLGHRNEAGRVAQPIASWLPRHVQESTSRDAEDDALRRGRARRHAPARRGPALDHLSLRQRSRSGRNKRESSAGAGRWRSSKRCVQLERIRCRDSHCWPASRSA